MHNGVTLFLTLKIFSATGGIEKVSRIVGMALHELGSASGNKVKVLSMYDRDNEIDEKYFPASMFRGFGISKVNFVKSGIREGVKSKIVVLSHVNLLKVGFLIKLFSPKTKLVLIAHGIEVWKPFSFWKRMMLKKCDRIFAVSDFTRDTMISLNDLTEQQFEVLNNCIDPFLPKPLEEEKSAILLDKYELKKDDIVLMTLSRLAAKESYKGYDKVLLAVKDLKDQYPNIRYLIVGKYDIEEKRRIDSVIEKMELQRFVIFAGFIPDAELAVYFNLADIYIMPSKKEGFGIVFIEALYYGKPVIAGNKDGSVSALQNGKFGLLVNPDNQREITAALKTMLIDKESFLPDHKQLMEKFSYPVYKENLKHKLDNLFT